MVQHLERTRYPGRNDPCPCGSGKKYKRCCLLRATAPAPNRDLDDVMVDLAAADEVGDVRAAIHILEEVHPVLHDTAVDHMLVERYLAMPPDEAETLLRKWWDQEHDRFSGAGLAQLLIAQDRKDEALTILKESQGSEALPDYWRLRALLQEERGEMDDAVQAMALYTRLAPEDAEGWMRLADLQQRAGMNERALLSLRRAGDTAPELILPRMLRVRILAEEGWWREVRDLAESLLEGAYDDSTPELLYDLRDFLARAYFVLGDFDGARHLWASLLAERPEDTQTRYRLASLEVTTRHYRRALLVLDADPCPDHEVRLLDLRLHCFLALQEYDEAALVARQIAEIEGVDLLVSLVAAGQAAQSGEYEWALQLLEGESPERYRDLWNDLRLDCLARVGRWPEVLPTLKNIAQPDDHTLIRAAMGAMASGKLDIAGRLIETIEDQQCAEVRSLNALLGPLRQSRRAAEVRRQQQVDESEKQRRSAENRDLRRRIRELETHNAALSEAMARSEAALERLLDLVGVSAQGGIPADWEAQLRSIAERAHKDALAQELQQAEHRLRSLLGSACWDALSESARVSLREGEWLFAAVEGEDRDFGAALLEYARGLERAFKDAVFVPVRERWQRQPGQVGHLQDESHDPSLGPFIRYVLQGAYLTLGSMAAALDRMADGRRRGVAVGLLRAQLGIDPMDVRALLDWKRTAERLAEAADARNQPAHAAAVNRDEVARFRELVLGTDGLLRALSAC